MADSPRPYGERKRLTKPMGPADLASELLSTEWALSKSRQSPQATQETDIWERLRRFLRSAWRSVTGRPGSGYEQVGDGPYGAWPAAASPGSWGSEPKPAQYQDPKLDRLKATIERRRSLSVSEHKAFEDALLEKLSSGKWKKRWSKSRQSMPLVEKYVAESNDVRRKSEDARERPVSSRIDRIEANHMYDGQGFMAAERLREKRITAPSPVPSRPSTPSSPPEPRASGWPEQQRANLLDSSPPGSLAGVPALEPGQPVDNRPDTALWARATPGRGHAAQGADTAPPEQSHQPRNAAPAAGGPAQDITPTPPTNPLSRSDTVSSMGSLSRSDTVSSMGSVGSLSRSDTVSSVGSVGPLSRSDTVSSMGSVGSLSRSDSDSSPPVSPLNAPTPFAPEWLNANRPAGAAPRDGQTERGVPSGPARPVTPVAAPKRGPSR